MILFNNTPLFTLGGGSSPFWVLNIEETTTEEGAGFRTGGELPDGNLLLGITVLQPAPLGNNQQGVGWVVCSPQGEVGLSRRKIISLGRGGQFALTTTDTASGDFYIEDNRELVKFDSDFNAVFARLLPDALSNPLALDVSENLYLPFSGGRGAGPNILKVNSSGTLQWSRRLSRSDFRAVGLNLDVYKPDGTVYAGVSNDDADTVDSFVAIVFSYTSAGTLRWQRRYIPAGSAGDSFRVVTKVYDEDEIYVTFSRAALGGATPGIVVLKINSSGDILWQTQILTGDLQFVPNANNTKIDTEGNLYFSFRFNTGPNIGTYVSKVGPTGNLLWTIKIDFTGFTNPTVDQFLTVTDDALYLGGFQNRGSLVRISKDGLALSGGGWNFSPVNFSTMDPNISVTNSNLTPSSPAESISTISDPFTDPLVWDETLTRL
jgi:hypothetical protein